MMKHQKTWLIEKEWDDFVKGSFVVDGIDRIPERNKKIAFGYTNLEVAKQDCEKLNKECAQCPRRTALHTTYRLLEHPIHVRIVTADDTYQSKMQKKDEL